MKLALTCLPLIALVGLSACGQSTSPLGSLASDHAQSLPHTSPAPRLNEATPTPDPREKNPNQGPRKLAVAASNTSPLGGACTVGCTDGPDGSTWTIGVTSEGYLACRGTAVQCAGASCSGSPVALGDPMVVAGESVRVTEMNSLWRNKSNYGWLYQGGDGNRYVQLDLTSSDGKTLAADFFQTEGTVGSYTRVKVWNGSVPTGTDVHRCETRGALLI